MEFIVDTVDLNDIQDAVDHLNLAGVTSNPSIVKKTSPKEFFPHMRKVREIIGKDRSLHVQLTATTSDEQLKEAERIFKEIDDQVYIKVPVDWEGLRTIRILKEEGRHVTATAIYDIMQAYEALAANADYLAVYVNRVGSMGGDPYALVRDVENVIHRDGYKTKVLGASFHSVQQVRDTLNAGAEAVTVPVSVLKATYANANIHKAVEDFNNDWQSVYGEGSSILTVK